MGIIMKETITEEKVVEEEREVIICDYCRLFTSEEVDEEFGEIFLNPSTIESGVGSYGHHRLENMAEMFARTDDEQRILRRLYDILVEDFEAQADLCPNCQEDLFGDGPASMRRDADVEVTLDG